MSVEQKNIVDFIIEEKDGKKGLIITDHLKWDDDDLNHLYLIQEKINAYISGIDSGQLNNYYKEAKNGFRIRLICQYLITKNADSFLEKVKNFLATNGIDFKYAYCNIEINNEP